jgi:hypothetical protein
MISFVALAVHVGCPEDKLDEAWLLMSQMIIPDNPSEILNDVRRVVAAVTDKELT